MKSTLFAILAFCGLGFTQTLPNVGTRIQDSLARYGADTAADSTWTFKFARIKDGSRITADTIDCTVTCNFNDTNLSVQDSLMAGFDANFRDVAIDDLTGGVASIERLLVDTLVADSIKSRRLKVVGAMSEEGGIFLEANTGAVDSLKWEVAAVGNGQLRFLSFKTGSYVPKLSLSTNHATFATGVTVGADSVDAISANADTGRFIRAMATRFALGSSSAASFNDSQPSFSRNSAYTVALTGALRIQNSGGGGGLELRVNDSAQVVGGARAARLHVTGHSNLDTLLVHDNAVFDSSAVFVSPVTVQAKSSLEDTVNMGDSALFVTRDSVMVSKPLKADSINTRALTVTGAATADSLEGTVLQASARLRVGGPYLFTPGDGNMELSVSGVQRFTFEDGGTFVADSITAPDINASSRLFVTDTYKFSPGDGSLALEVPGNIYNFGDDGSFGADRVSTPLLNLDATPDTGAGTVVLGVASPCASGTVLYVPFELNGSTAYILACTP